MKKRHRGATYKVLLYRTLFIDIPILIVYQIDMHVIARKTLIDFGVKHPDARMAIDRWWVICRKNTYASFSDLKKTFSTAELVNKCAIFNIGGGKYRLIVRVNFVAQRMWIKYLLTHKEYDKLDLKEDSKCRP